jgi:hypothetical protein
MIQHGNRPIWSLGKRQNRVLMSTVDGGSEGIFHCWKANHVIPKPRTLREIAHSVESRDLGSRVVIFAAILTIARKTQRCSWHEGTSGGKPHSIERAHQEGRRISRNMVSGEEGRGFRPSCDIGFPLRESQVQGGGVLPVRLGVQDEVMKTPQLGTTD